MSSSVVSAAIGPIGGAGVCKARLIRRTSVTRRVPGGRLEVGPRDAIPADPKRDDDDRRLPRTRSDWPPSTRWTAKAGVGSTRRSMEDATQRPGDLDLRQGRGPRDVDGPCHESSRSIKRIAATQSAMCTQLNH